MYRRSAQAGETSQPWTIAKQADAAEKTPCTSGQSDSANIQTVGGITPIVPAPEAETVGLVYSPRQPVSQAVSYPQAGGSLGEGSITTGCSRSVSNGLETPAPVPPTVSIPAEDAPEPPSYGSLGQTDVGGSTICADCPMFSPQEQAPSVVESAGRVGSPNGEYQNLPTTRENCTATSRMELSTMAPSESTSWPQPSSYMDPPADPPVPSQVPGSDSRQGFVPCFSAIGGLALIAAMMM